MFISDCTRKIYIQTMKFMNIELKKEIERWKEQATSDKTHLIIVTDTFDYEEYPVYVDKTEQLEEVKKKYDNVNMQRICEVIKL